MKLAFSNSTCLQSSLAELIERSKAWGYQGFELSGLDEQSSPGPVITLRGDPAGVRRQLADANQQIVALNTGALDPPADWPTDSGMLRISQAIELAADAACPRVVTTGTPLTRGANKARLLQRYVNAFTRLARLASQKGVTLAIENGGVFAQSVDTWHIWDAVGSPALRVCLNPLSADRAGDSPSRALTRLRGALAMVRLACTQSAPSHDGERFVELDRRATNAVFVLELLKGLAYDGWLCVDCAAGAAPTDRPSLDQALERAAVLLRTEVNRPIVELTAYKGDTNAPKFVPRAPSGRSPATA